jgi:hypothetical protein
MLKTMKSLSILLILFISMPCLGQPNISDEDLKRELKPVQNKIGLLAKKQETLVHKVLDMESELAALKRTAKDLKDSLNQNKAMITNARATLSMEIDATEESSENKIGIVNQQLTRNTLYGIIGVLSAILLSGLLYWLLSRRQQTDKSDFIDQLSKTKSSIEESLVKEFGKQTELMEAQLLLLESQKNNLSSYSNATPDHSLALKVADEITLIERNISLMDAGTKGLKQLSRSVEKIKDNLSANGYDIPTLLGKPFNQGMRIVPVSTIPDESLEAGAEIITKVIKPQVNFNDKMIQAAQIEVSVGY